MYALPTSTAGRTQRMLVAGPITLDLKLRKVFVGSQRVPLTAREFDVLELLVQTRGTVMPKQVILEQLYGTVEVPDQKIIDVFVCKIRRKLRDATGGNGVIDTVWGRGYIVRQDSRSPQRRVAAGGERRHTAAS